MRRWLPVVGVVGALLVAAPTATARTDGCVRSVPEPGTTEPVAICYSLFRPRGADAAHPVPIVLDSHGWSASRTRDAHLFTDLLAAGIGVITFDQRGFGESGGRAHWQHPDVEGRDIARLLDVVTALDWVREEAPGDPVVGALGASYGGGYQYAAAFTDARLDALVPRITWWDANGAFAPSGVVRSWWTALIANDDEGALPEKIRAAMSRAAATGTWTDDLRAFFDRNGPRWHVEQGRRLDIPVLLHQGATDTLFTLNDAIAAYDGALTPAARARSLLVGFNGGHVTPGVAPLGASGVDDPCARRLTGTSFWPLVTRFFRETLRGEETGLDGHGRYHLATAGDACVSVDDIRADTAFAVGAVTSAGGPTAWPVTDGPITVAGVPQLETRVTTWTPEARTFLALAVGTSPADARIVQGNMAPLREPVSVTAAARRLDLPAVAVEVAAGESLYLMVSPVWDSMFASSGRPPSVVALDDVVVHLPTA